VKLILSQRLHVMAAAAVTVLGSMFAINTATKSVEAIDTNTSAQHQAQSNDSEATAKDSAKTVVKTNSILHPAKKIVIKPGRNLIAEANERAAAKKAAEAKAAALKAAQAAAAQKAAQEKAAQVAAAQKAAAAKQAAAQQQAASQSATTTTTSTTTTTNKGTFKLSFYDPAVMGSNMGYSGVAANLSTFPRGTKLKITLSDGTVWYRTVNDTGSFAAGNPNQLDVAMPSSQIPSAGVLYATVEVVG
jgi:3D (Asp-Asp-Asp) domain-containing protein